MSAADAALKLTPIDAESQLQDASHTHQQELRVWLRLLTCANLIEGEIRSRLREHFDTTLPRFDLMAQLERSEDGIQLGELSRRMMVSNGNITGLVDRLVQSGLIERRVSETDRRAARVRLTDAGRELFNRMAAAHADWMAELFGQLDEREQEALWTELGHLKLSVRSALSRSRAQDNGNKAEQ